MANPRPPYVLLERVVFFGGRELPDGTWKDAAGIVIGWSRARLLSRREAMEAMEPHPFLADPPQVSSLRMMSPTPAHAQQLGSIRDGDIASTHKGIVVIYAGFYRPGCSDDLGGCYLLYDAPTNALTAIPPLPDSPRFPTLLHLGRTAVLVDDSRSADDYILADIVTNSGLGLPEATIFAWSSLTMKKSGGEWVKSSIPRLPLPAHLCGPKHLFQIDLAFSLDSGRICWVDLLQGILFCDRILAPDGPKLGFIPLPTGYCIDVHHRLRHQMMPLARRSMACVSGAVKFVALVGLEDIHCPPNEVMLKTWVLSPDFKEWKEDSRSLSVEEMWASESFKQMGLPCVVPVSPVLSLTQDGVMYTILNVIEQVPAQVDEFGIVVVDDDLVPIANYMIRFDIRRNKVLSSTKISQHGELQWLIPNLIATDFTAYLQDHQVLSVLATACYLPSAPPSVLLASYPNCFTVLYLFVLDVSDMWTLIFVTSS